MRKLMLLFLIPLCLFADPQYIVFAIWGQSNAVGKTTTHCEEINYSGRVLVYDNLNRLRGLSGDHYDQDFSENSTLVDYDSPLENDGSVVNILCNKILEHWNGNILITTGARGATALVASGPAVWGEVPPSATDTTYIRSNAMKNLSQAVAAVGASNIRAAYLIWMQGETDASLENDSAEYTDSLDVLFDWINTYSPVSIKKIVVGLGHDYAVGASDEFYDNIYNGQLNCVSGRSDALITPRALKTNGVSYVYSATHEVHYDTGGMRTIAGWIADTVLADLSLSDVSYAVDTFTFGNRTGMSVTSGHKDTYVYSSVSSGAYPDNNQLLVKFYNTDTVTPLLRFNFGNALPENFVASGAQLHLFLKAGNGAVNTVTSVYDMLTDWGINDTDDGSNQTTASSGQASYRRSIDFNGAGGDVDWANSGYFSDDDLSSLITQFTSLISDVVETEHIVSIPASIVQSWIDNGYAGVAIRMVIDQNRTDIYYSQEEATESVRPYLEINAYSSAIPVIDSVRDSTALRDSTYLQAARPSDTIKVFGSNFSTAGENSILNLNSSGSVVGTLLSVTDTLVVAIVPSDTPRGWYSIWFQTKYIVPGSPKRHGLLIKRPGGL